jgi:hypothetical protein
MIKFVKYLLIWVSSNLSVPFWVVGHVHLTMNIYKDLHEIIASLLMNIIVAIGFWISWLETKNNTK